MTKTFDEWVNSNHRNSSYSKLQWIAECVEKGHIEDVLSIIKEAYYDGKLDADIKVKND